MPARRLGRFAIAVLCAALFFVIANFTISGASHADAATLGPAHRTETTAPPYQLEGFTWPRLTSASVYYTWDGGPCVINGTDLSGPASAVSPAAALQTLQASLNDINSQLRGGLVLVNAGAASRADLCRTSTARPIVVGFGNIGPVSATSKTGLALSFGLTSSATPNISTYQAARVFISDVYTFACPGSLPYRDLQGTMTHELLHAIGIGHSQDPKAVMTPSNTACQSSYLLQPDDIAALAALYPPPPVGISAGSFAAPPSFSAAGQAFAVFTDGSVDQLSAAASSVLTTGVWAQTPGRKYLLYVIGGPTFVNSAFRSSFAAGFSTPTAVTLVR